MSQQKFVIGFLVVLIAVFAYMIASLVYRENNTSDHNIKALELTDQIQ